MKHRNIALFIPHMGCPHNCVFCNQHCITGNAVLPHADDVIKAAEKANERKAEYTQLAFFGGSFTAIDRDYMLELLESAGKCMERGLVDSVRISTRPDCITDDILDILEFYHVEAIELGAQSMDDNVLSLSERGHTAQDVADASELIKKRGFSLGLQMMTGLPGDTHELSLRTAEKLASFEPDTVRIYPTVTLKGTELEEMLKSGKYTPTGLDESVALCSELLLFFESKNIKVIKLGLQYEDSMKENYIAGAFHPAFRELCESRIYMDIILNGMEKYGCKDMLNIIEVAKGEISKAVGQGRSNSDLIKSMGYKLRIIENTGLQPRDIIINGVRMK